MTEVERSTPTACTLAISPPVVQLKATLVCPDSSVSDSDPSLLSKSKIPREGLAFTPYPKRKLLLATEDDNALMYMS